jgi:hypothetical protein
MGFTATIESLFVKFVEAVPAIITILSVLVVRILCCKITAEPNPKNFEQDWFR